MAQITEVINCPFCGSGDAVRFRERADIVRCRHCDLVYLRTRPTQESMYEIYQAYANDTSHMKPPGSAAAAKASGLRRDYFVEEVLSFTDSKGVWLDIGCGWGALLDNVKERGFIPKGIEVTRNCLDFAVMQLGIPVSNSQFLDSCIDQDSCAVITMVHVYEHLPYPKESLQKIFACLKPGGIFCGIVPNIASLCSEHKKEDWVWLDPTHHYVHYSPVTLKEKFKEAGFNVERMYTAIGDYEYADFLACTRAGMAAGVTQEEVIARAAAYEPEGKGEEIRFFIRKPF